MQVRKNLVLFASSVHVTHRCHQTLSLKMPAFLVAMQRGDWAAPYTGVCKFLPTLFFLNSITDSRPPIQKLHKVTFTMALVIYLLNWRLQKPIPTMQNMTWY